MSKVLSLDYLSCPQIWNIGLEKVGGRPAKLNEEKGDRSEILSQRQKRRDEEDIFCWKNNVKIL